VAAAAVAIVVRDAIPNTWRVDKAVGWSVQCSTHTSNTWTRMR